MGLSTPEEPWTAFCHAGRFDPEAPLLFAKAIDGFSFFIDAIYPPFFFETTQSCLSVFGLSLIKQCRPLVRSAYLPKHFEPLESCPALACNRAYQSIDLYTPPRDEPFRFPCIVGHICTMDTWLRPVQPFSDTYWKSALFESCQAYICRGGFCLSAPRRYACLP